MSEETVETQTEEQEAPPKLKKTKKPMKKKATKKVASKKKATKSEEKEYGIKDLAKELKTSPAMVRVKLRDKKVKKDGKSYGWDTKHELEAVAKRLAA